MRSGLLLAATLALAGAAACHKNAADAPEIVPGAPAGDVTEVAGTVTATRNGATRALAVGDVIAGDDLIKTGTDGRVTVVLRHNRVPWSLGPGKEKKVADSLAWSAAEGASAESVSDDRSAAAGRHAERSATDTESSAAGASGAPGQSPPDPTAAAVRAEAAHRADEAAHQAEEAANLEAKLGAASQETEREKLRAALDQERATADQERIGGNAKGGRNAPRCDPNDPLCEPDGSGGGRNSGSDTSPVLESQRMTRGDEPSPLRAEAERRVRAKTGELQRCLDRLAPHGHGKLTITLDVADDGTVTKVTLTTDPSLQPMTPCAHDVALALRFPRGTKAWSLQVPFSFPSSK